MYASLYLHITVAFSNLCIGGYVLLKNPKSLIHRAFFIFVLGIVGWEVGMILLFITQNLAWIAPTLLSGELVAVALVLLSEVFPENECPKVTTLFILGPLFVIAAITPLGLFITEARFNGGKYFEPVNGPLFPLFTVAIGLCILYSFWNFWRKYRKAVGIRRVQLRYLGTGIAIFIGSAFLLDVLLPALHVFEFCLLGPLCSVAFLGFVGYGIVRYGLMDIDIIIKRGIAYVCSILLVAAIFFGFEFIIERLYSNDEIVDIACAMLGGFAFSFIRSFFERITDRIFFRKDYDYGESVRELGPLLSSTIHLEPLLGVIDSFLSKTIKPKSVIFFLTPSSEPAVFEHGIANDKRQYLERYRSLVKPFFGTAHDAAILQDGLVAAVVPLYAKGQTVAVMLLEEKLSDDIFRPKDIKLLAVISHQAGIAIENAGLYEAIRKHTETLEDMVNERTKDIKEVYRERSDFLTDVSHQLQTPIAILQGNLELAERHRGKSVRDSLKTMRNTLNGMSQLVSGFLDLARLNFSKNKLHKACFDMGELVREIHDDCSVLADMKGVRLICATDMLMVSGDRRKIKEVLLNLASNALKHTPRGGTIHLDADHQMDAPRLLSAIPVAAFPQKISAIFLNGFIGSPEPTAMGMDWGLTFVDRSLSFTKEPLPSKVR